MITIKVNLKELTSLLDFIEDKVEDCYSREIKEVITTFYKQLPKNQDAYIKPYIDDELRKRL